MLCCICDNAQWLQHSAAKQEAFNGSLDLHAKSTFSRRILRIAADRGKCYLTFSCFPKFKIRKQEIGQLVSLNPKPNPSDWSQLCGIPSAFQATKMCWISFLRLAGLSRPVRPRSAPSVAAFVCPDSTPQPQLQGVIRARDHSTRERRQRHASCVVLVAVLSLCKEWMHRCNIARRRRGCRARARSETRRQWLFALLRPHEQLIVRWTVPIDETNVDPSDEGRSLPCWPCSWHPLSLLL